MWRLFTLIPCTPAAAGAQAVPDAFDSWGQYAAAWADALHEELNLR